jgi:hypothetical protein
MKAFINKYLIKVFVGLLLSYGVCIIGGIVTTNNMSVLNQLFSWVLFSILFIHLILWIGVFGCLIGGLIEGRKVYAWSASFILLTIIVFAIIIIASPHC